ncbi:MalY/PatB family protein [Defluviitalea saccharophila]|jgi:cystathionine beta-lyase|uniref:cysteine-S-conjugate beta-lyase n=1 Tax=Defluviitalea saccharophila TaxID=879970 RepID=A0ABZ2YAC3_9FIRM
MTYNFDEIIDRKNTNSIKYDFAAERGKPEDILPLWVADMDFRTPSPVIEALVKAAQHGIFGYSDTKEEYFWSVYNWYNTRFNWSVKREWLVKTPGVVYGIATAIRALTDEGDAVMIQQPVYYPFSDLILANQRKLINNPLIYKNGKYYMDFEDFEEKIIKHKVKIFILCSPHNPVGRVWTNEELTRVGDLCIKHNVMVISDEIHGDFTYKGIKHFVFADLKPEYLNNSIICTAPSKTFNLAGLQVSNIFIPNRDIRRKFKEEMKRTGYSQLNTLGLVACQAAYEHGAPWLEELKEYLEGNLEFIRNFLAERLPQIKIVEPEGTYLVWLDCRALNLSEEELEDLIVNKAKLWLDGGTMFGREGEGFQRINIACPRVILEKAFLQLEEGIKSAFDN